MELTAARIINDRAHKVSRGHEQQSVVLDGGELSEAPHPSIKMELGRFRRPMTLDDGMKEKIGKILKR